MIKWLRRLWAWWCDLRSQLRVQYVMDERFYHFERQLRRYA